MARTAKKRMLVMANRRRRGTVAPSSGGIHIPGPDEGPAWAAEESADEGQDRGHEYEPGHDPFRQRDQGEEAPERLPIPFGAGHEHGGGHNQGGHHDGPALEGREEDHQK